MDLREQFAAERDRFLVQAFEDVQKWCVEPGALVGRKHSEQHWVSMFTEFRASRGKKQRLDEASVGDFLKDYGLHEAEWDKTRLIECLGDINRAVRKKKLRASVGHSIVSRLEKSLRRRAHGDRQSTSAASKLAMFSHPNAEIFVWDTNSRISAEWRQASQDDGNTVRTADSSLFQKRSGTERRHDYKAFHRACRKALRRERKNEDFEQKIDALMKHLDSIDGPMKKRKVCSKNYIRRRFLDKLMYWEGRWLKEAARKPRIAAAAGHEADEIAPVT